MIGFNRNTPSFFLSFHSLSLLTLSHQEQAVLPTLLVSDCFDPELSPAQSSGVLGFRFVFSVGFCIIVFVTGSLGEVDEIIRNQNKRKWEQGFTTPF